MRRTTTRQDAIRSWFQVWAEAEEKAYQAMRTQIEIERRERVVVDGKTITLTQDYYNVIV